MYDMKLHLPLSAMVYQYYQGEPRSSIKNINISTKVFKPPFSKDIFVLGQKLFLKENIVKDQVGI